jgi:hypothetical protein
MDDDDYYPPERVSHAVDVLQANPQVDIAFCPVLYFYYPTENRIYSCGPWDTNWPHATFAFRRKYLETHSYQSEDKYGEERMFTDYFKAPHVTLNPDKTILALVHNENTVPKNNLGKRVPSRHTLHTFIRDRRSLVFYGSRAGKVGGPVVLNPHQKNPRLLLSRIKVESVCLLGTLFPRLFLGTVFSLWTKARMVLSGLSVTCGALK